MSADANGEGRADPHPGNPVAFPASIEQWPTVRLLSTASRLAKHAWNEQLESADLTHAGFVALDVLITTGPLTPTRLAEIARVTAQTMGRILGRLETHGHVTRERNPTDRRLSHVTITPDGIKALAQALASERQLLSVAVDTQALRHDLKVIVRELTRHPEGVQGRRDPLPPRN